MLGLGEEKTKAVGAKEKVAIAKRMRDIARAEMLRKSGKGQGQSQTIPATVIYVLAVIFAMVMTDDTASGLSSWHPTGIYNIDRVLVGSGIPSFTGDMDLNRLILILIRGTAFFVAMGIIPFLALVLSQMVKTLHPLVACWGIAVGGPVFYMLFTELLFPLFGDLMAGF